MPAFGSVLQQLRKERHLTQEQLAQTLGLAKSSISMYENGKREPDFVTMEQLADYFGVDMDTLYGRAPSVEATVRIDADSLEILRAVRERPEMKILFSVSRDVTAEELIEAIHIVEGLKSREDPLT